MQHTQFTKGETLIKNGEKITGIYLIRSGIIKVKLRTSLFKEFEIQRLYPGCSYGAYAFFADEESSYRESRFSMTAVSPGDYFFISFGLLRQLGQNDATM